MSDDTKTPFELSLEKERAENRARRERHIAILSAIKIDGWEYKTDEEQYDRTRGLGELVNPSIQGVIDFTQDWRDNEKIHIGVSFPRDSQNQDHVGYKETRPSINVSSKKTSEQIAKDIQRRLLPDYLALLEKVRERIAGTESYLNSKVELGKALHTAFPSLKLNDTVNGVDYHGHKRNGQEVSLSSDYGLHPSIGVICSTKTVGVSLDDLTLEQAKQIISLAVSFQKGRE